MGVANNGRYKLKNEGVHSKNAHPRLFLFIFYLLHYLLAVDNVQALAHSIDVVAHNLAVDRVDARVLIGVCGGCCNLVYASRQREVVVAFL